MSRAKAPPRIKGPYSERGGTRFRIRILNRSPISARSSLSNRSMTMNSTPTSLLRPRP